MSYVSIEELQKIKEYYDKQEERRHPCSNQVVVCGIITEDKNLAVEFMKDKNVVKKLERKDEIIWELDNGEYWKWKHWSKNCIGQRFHKIAIDRFIDGDLLRYVILPSCANYCCSVEII